ncbi:MAG: amidohydrolase family protein [Bacteroidota bacterium]
MYNSHTHIFTTAYVPENVVGQQNYLFGATKFLGVSRVSKWNPNVVSTLKVLFKWNKKLNRTFTFAQIGLASTQEDIFTKLENYYNGWGDMQYVVLTMDMEMMGAGPVQSNFETQLYQIINLRTKGQNRNRLLPFICIDPRKPKYVDGQALLDFVKPYFDTYGFVGIKLYPALGYYPFDPKLYKLYDWCIQHSVPLLSHCIQGVIHYRGDLKVQPPLPAEITAAGFKPDNNSTDPYTYQRNYTQPQNFEWLMKIQNGRFKDLKICLAHYGGEDDIKKDTGWKKIIDGMITAHANVYADVSYVIQDKDTYKNIAAAMKNPAIQKKILFGTDYFVVSKARLENDIAVGFRSYMQNEGQITDFFNASNQYAHDYLKSDFYN